MQAQRFQYLYFVDKTYCYQYYNLFVVGYLCKQSQKIKMVYVKMNMKIKKDENEDECEAKDDDEDED